MKLHVESFGGNLFEAATTINKLDWAKYVVEMDVVGMYTIVVFKMPTIMVHAIRAANPCYKSEPNHDDPKNN